MKKVLAIFAVVLCMSMMTGCTTATSLGGAVGGHGLISGFGAPSHATAGASEIASYSVWLGLFDAGYSSYAGAVRQAEADGKVVTSVTKWYYIFVTTTAYAK